MNNNKNITVKQAIDRYIESKTAVLSPSTIYGYKKANQRYLYILHDVKIAKLDQELIQRAINKLSYCYSPKTVRNAYGLLHASLQMFAPDFVYRISLPQKIKSSFYVPDENEIKVIYKLIKNTELEIPFLLASQALLLGIPQKYIAELMGHSSTDMIEKVYQHTFPSTMEEFKVRIADNIEKLLG